jgi:AcrR family transcriptional regulator
MRTKVHDSPRVRLNREKILNTAGYFFGQKGYIATSIDDIAKAAKMNKASIYYYFKNKAAILHELGTMNVQAMIDQALPITNSNIPFEEKLKLFIINHIQFLLSRLNLTGIEYKERKHLPSKLFKIYINLRDQYEGLFRAILGEGIKEGALNCKDVKVASLVILGLLNSTLQWFKPEGRLSLDDIANEIHTFVSNGLKVKSKSSNKVLTRNESYREASATPRAKADTQKKRRR